MEKLIKWMNKHIVLTFLILFLSGVLTVILADFISY